MLFDEKTQMGGTENCWLGREAAAMGPEPWSCTSLKSVCGNITHRAPPCDTHITHPRMVEFGCGSVVFFFFLTSLKQQKRTNVRALEAMHSCVTNKQTTLCNSDRAGFIHCVILIFLLKYTVIAWSIPFETFSMGFVCLFVFFAGLLLFNLYEEEGNQWVVYFRLLSCCSVCKWFILFHHFCLKREVFLLGFLYGAHLFSI